MDFATDIGGVVDLDAAFAVVSGRTARNQRLARLLTTPRGSLPYAPNRGVDVREWLNDTSTPKQLQARRAAVQAELEADEEVDSATVTLSYDGNTGALGVVAQLTDATQTSTLTLAITATSVAILSGGG